jgi:hypothetical protein
VIEVLHYRQQVFNSFLANLSTFCTLDDTPMHGTNKQPYFACNIKKSLNIIALCELIFFPGSKRLYDGWMR